MSNNAFLSAADERIRITAPNVPKGKSGGGTGMK
jgi:hypothetical protein